MPPPNDAFALATTLGGATVSTSVRDQESTTETGEPVHAEGVYADAEWRGSVWYRWIAPSTGPTTVTVHNGCVWGAAPVVGVYTGTQVYALGGVARAAATGYSPDNCLQAQTTFDAVAGRSYSFAVVAAGSRTTLSISQ
jgi:hypothetical protein